MRLESRFTCIPRRYHVFLGGQFLVGIGFIDTNLCEIKYAEFFDNDHFSNLESVILQLGPKECVVAKLVGIVS